MRLGRNSPAVYPANFHEAAICRRAQLEYSALEEPGIFPARRGAAPPHRACSSLSSNSPTRSRPTRVGRSRSGVHHICCACFELAPEGLVCERWKAARSKRRPWPARWGARRHRKQQVGSRHAHRRGALSVRRNTKRRFRRCSKEPPPGGARIAADALPGPNVQASRAELRRQAGAKGSAIQHSHRGEWQSWS